MPPGAARAFQRRLAASRIGLLLAVLLAHAAPAAAADGWIQGVVGIRPGPGESGAPLPDAVVAVEGDTVPAPAGAPHAVMEQRDHTFHPHVVAIGVGTTVDFVNHDPVFHDVNSPSPAQPFDLGMFGTGETRSMTFTSPGVIRVRCNVHPTMQGLVVVHANPWVALSDARGRYTIRPVPPGMHRVRLWHDGFVPREVTVSVPDGMVAPLDVQLEREH